MINNSLIKCSVRILLALWSILAVQLNLTQMSFYIATYFYKIGHWCRCYTKVIRKFLSRFFFTDAVLIFTIWTVFANKLLTVFTLKRVSDNVLTGVASEMRHVFVVVLLVCVSRFYYLFWWNIIINTLVIDKIRILILSKEFHVFLRFQIWHF